MTSRKRERPPETDSGETAQYKLGDRLQCRWRNATRQDRMIFFFLISHLFFRPL